MKGRKEEKGKQKLEIAQRKRKERERSRTSYIFSESIYHFISF
jgi:hypothetical protein